ncbi:hypothetical protein CYY_008219 [Polysphondylium violaceum]|uniref:RNA helicase n=1 Tax=Polysphondylium violaceum TaxID=133409 RepID=A0A8J4V465_9MYCE|nr:hypothetical protein CYY_008219 [Polysphondylium violaceum]
MPIGNKNENDGSPLNNLSGLTISDKKSQTTSTTSTTNEPSVYVPPSRRNRMSSSTGSNSGSQPQSPAPSNDRDSRERQENRDPRDFRDNRDPRDFRDNRDNNNNTDSDRRDNYYDNRGGDNYNRGGYNNRQDGGYNRNSPQQYGGGAPRGSDRWGDNNRGGGGGYNNYSPNPSFGRSSFNRGGGGGYNKGNRYDRYFEKWSSFKDSRNHPDMPREVFNLDEEKAEEIFKSNSNHGIDFNSYDDDDISIETSEHLCAPINSFSDVDLGDILFANIKHAKYTKPTPVQKSALPIISKGRDLMACAQTGSGKTAAFLFPIISGILLDGCPEQPSTSYRVGVPRPAQPRALVLAPTRELAQQIYDEANKFSYASPVSSVVIYGGADVSHQIGELEKGVDILVATTGRLVDLLDRGRVSLSKVKYLVLDEADRMLDMGFEPQIRAILGDYDMPGNRDRQTLMFSATFPKQIQALATDFLNNYIYLKVGVVGTTQNITQRIEYVAEDEKNSYLLDYLSNLKSDQGLTLVFVETKRACDTLTYYLNKSQFPTTCIHGDLSQAERENALQSFRSFQTPFLVATDIASRGLHIPKVMYVINYDLPTDVDVYVHRIGRTGRAGKKGFAISFFNEKNKPVAADLLKLFKQSNQETPEWFEKMVHSFKSSKGPMNKKYDNKGYHNNNNYYSNNNRRGSGGDDRRGGGGGSGDDYSMHHHFFSKGGSYN